MSLKPIINRITEDDDYYYYEQKGERGCMYPECRGITFITINHDFKIGIDTLDFSFPKHTIVCEYCGTEFVNDTYEMLDPNIAEAVSLLNKAGLQTDFSCEGHTVFESGEFHFAPYISFVNAEDIIKYKDNIPENWYISIDTTYLSNGMSKTIADIYYDTFGDYYKDIGDYNKEKEMADIYDWAAYVYKNEKG